MPQHRGSTPKPQGSAAPDRVSRSGAGLRRCIALAIGSSYFLAGCYTYVPVASTPAAGKDVGFEISDAGRVALGDRLGPGVTRVEGQVTDASNEEYVVAVKTISQINGGRSSWSGESIRLRREYVVRSEERKLSRGRTALTIGAVIAGFAAVVLTRSLLGGSGGVREGSGGSGPGES